MLIKASCLFASCGPELSSTPLEKRASSPSGEAFHIVGGRPESGANEISSPPGTHGIDAASVAGAQSGEPVDLGGEKDRLFFAQISHVSVGEEISVQPDASDADTRWDLFGFLPSGEGRYRRDADLTGELVDLVPANSRALLEIDCIAVISVDRGDEQESYLYTTLRSMFAIMPNDAHVNVLVGNADAAYVGAEALQKVLGADQAARVHAWPTSQRTATFLREHLKPSDRGGWNTVRGLRSYRGTRGLLLMEDDILWSGTKLVEIDAALRSTSLAVLTLYNKACKDLVPLASSAAASQLASAETATSPLFITDIDPRTYSFDCMQAVYYRAPLTEPLGQYTHRRMGVRHHDCVVGDFFHERHILVGYPFPSLVQHIGRNSAYKSWAFHESACFRAPN